GEDRGLYFHDSLKFFIDLFQCFVQMRSAYLTKSLATPRFVLEGFFRGLLDIPRVVKNAVPAFLNFTQGLTQRFHSLQGIATEVAAFTESFDLGDTLTGAHKVFGERDIARKLPNDSV